MPNPTVVVFRSIPFRSIALLPFLLPEKTTTILPEVRLREATIVLHIAKDTALVSQAINRCPDAPFHRGGLCDRLLASYACHWQCRSPPYSFPWCPMDVAQSTTRRPKHHATDRLCMLMRVERMTSRSWQREVEGPRPTVGRLRIVGVGHHERSSAMLVVDRVVVVQHRQPIRRRAHTLGTVIALSRC
jgi:hypothetical protein